MKAPTSSPRLQLLLPHPAQVRRLRWLLCGTLLAAAAFLLCLLLAYFWAGPQLPVVARWAALLASGWVLGWWGYILTRHELPHLTALVREWVQGVFRVPYWLGLLIVIPAIRLISLLALETDQALTDLLMRHSGLLVWLVVLSGLLFFRVPASNVVDRLCFRRLRTQEEQLALLLEEVKMARNLRAAAQESIHGFKELWQPRHIRLLFREALQCDFHFSVDETLLPTHLPPHFPLSSLFAPAISVREAPGAVSPNLTEADMAWLVSLQAEVVVPMIGANSDVIGMLTLGHKQSAQPYTHEEKQVLLALTEHLARLSERDPAREKVEQDAERKLAQLALLEAEQRNLLEAKERKLLAAAPNSEKEEHDHDPFLVQKHLNDLPQRQELPARVG